MTKAASLAAANGLLALTCSRTPLPDPAWVAEVEAWRARRPASLTGPDGWLTLVGLHWLQPGRNRVGSGIEAEVYLNEAQVPAHVATLELTPDRRVLLDPVPGSGFLVNGEPAEPGPLTTDRGESPSLLSLGPLRMVVIQRQDRFALRVRNPDSPLRINFPGLEYFPLDPRLRLAAHLEPFAEPREVTVPVAQGPPQRFLVSGVVRFSLNGRALSLLPLVSSPDDDAYFVIFRDATSGKETYGGGRFLNAAAPPSGSLELTLDFNFAYTPPAPSPPTPPAPCHRRRRSSPSPFEPARRGM